jgi:hypothetical protein
VGGAIKPDGLDQRRVVQVITTRRANESWRGSGYQVTRDLVLTAAHVVCDARTVQVRFLTTGRGTRELHGKPVWTNPALDIALISIADESCADGPAAAEVSWLRFARIEQPMDCEALGFPRFRLRAGAASSDRGVNVSYRDSHHARGEAAPLSNYLEGSLEITLKASPERDPEPGRSPWEGMSGAPVWSGGYVIGVITKHHRSDGLSTLAASPVDRWYEQLAPDEINELSALIGLPARIDQLEHLPRSSPLGAPELRGAAEQLAARVTTQWGKEERRRNVHDPFPLPVRFRNADTCLFDHWSKIRDAPPGTDPGPLALAGRLDQIVRVYRSIPSRRLVVLGAAGSGKTILTLRFVLDWLEVGRSPDRPVPVIFSLGSWDPTAISLRDWMCHQLVRDYGLAAPTAHGGNLAGALVDAGRILPVLDGFDEIAGGLQHAALKELDRTTTSLLLTSRPREYAEAVKSRPLPKAAVVELKNLTVEDIAVYLPLTSRPGKDGGRHNTRWEPVLAELREQRRSPGAENVATVLTTPLMVAMARTVYSDALGREPEKLLDTDTFATPEALQKHLLAAFTPAAYEPSPADSDSGTGRGCRRHWDPDRAQHWLGYLAAHLDRLGRESTGVPARDLAWWQLGTTMRRSSRMLVIGFLAALALGVTTAIGNVPADLIATSHELEFALVRGLVVGLLHGLVNGLFFGMVYGFVSQGAAEPSRVRIQVFGRTGGRRASFLPRFKLGLVYGALAALVILFLDRVVVESLGLADGLDGGLTGALVFAPGLALGVGLVLGLIAWLEVPIDIRSGVSSSDLLSQDRRNVIFYLLVWALVFGTGAGFANGLKDGPVWGLLVGIAFGMEAAFGGGLAYRLSFTAWGQWVALARMWLPLTGQLPWRLVAFLDDACERDVLRQAGAVYQFRHAQLQDHLTQAFLAGRDQKARRFPPRRLP